MEPISLSLMAISACSIAIRRIDAAQRAERLSASERSADVGPRALVKHAVSKRTMDLAGSRGLSRGLRRSLVDLAPRHDVVVLLDTPLNDCVEVRGQNSMLMERALRSRKIDAIICDPTGLPLCGMDVPATDAAHEPDPIRTRIFRDAGLPLLVLPEDCTWHDALARLDAAFLLAMPEGSAPATPPKTRVVSRQLKSA